MRHIIIYAILLTATLAVAGCNSNAPADKESGYTHTRLMPRDINTVRVYLADNPTLRRQYELPITQAVIREIQSASDLRITDTNPDSILKLTIREIKERVAIENDTDAVESGSVTFYVEIEWTDARTGATIPVQRKVVSASGSFYEGRGDNYNNAAEEATKRLATLIVESMYENW